MAITATVNMEPLLKALTATAKAADVNQMDPTTRPPIHLGTASANMEATVAAAETPAVALFEAVLICDNNK
jgi:hypothetical protein